MNEPFIIIVDSNGIQRQRLSYYFRYKGLRFYKNVYWYLSLDEGYVFDDNLKLKKLDAIHYNIINQRDFESIEVYVYENDCGFDDYGFYQNRKFSFGKGKFDIECNDQYLDGKYFVYDNRKISSNFDVYLNGKKYHDQLIKEGDAVEMLGFKMFVFERYLYINSFNTINHLTPVKVSRQIIKYRQNIPEIENSLIIKKEPVFIDEDIKEFCFEEIKNNLSVNQLVPSTMMAFSMLSISLINFSNNNSVTGLIMPVTLLISSFIWPLFYNLAIKIKNKSLRKKAITRYENYLEEYHERLIEKIRQYQESLNGLICSYNLKDAFFLKRDDYSFLSINVGYCKLMRTQSLKNSVSEKATKQLEVINHLLKESLIPCFVDLSSYSSITLYCLENSKEYFFRQFLLELAYKHHFDDVKIALYAKDFRSIDEVSSLPHLFNLDKRMTYTSVDELRRLDEEIFDFELLVMMYDNADFIPKNKKIHVINFCDRVNDSSKDSKIKIIFSKGNGYIVEKEMPFTYYRKEINDKEIYQYLYNFNCHKFSKKTRTLFDLYEVSKEEIRNNYLKIPSGLKAVFSFRDDKPLVIDLHESKDGPHGLIGGMTGGGKTQLLTGMLLSLAYRYSPDYLNMILIDFKGGEIRQSLTHKKQLAHIVGYVENDDDNLDRLFARTRKELQIRLKLFKKLSSLSKDSINNLDDYLNSDYREYGLKPLPHLLFIVDEFAEVKKNNPEAMKEFVSISRIGRSLGVHLILCTQKPSGNIDDEIWSNSRFKIALKVADEADSTSIIKDKIASKIKEPGEFFVYKDGSLTKGKAIYTKFDCFGNEDFEVSLLDENLNVIKKERRKNTRNINSCKYTVDMINDVCDEKENNIQKWDIKRHDMQEYDGLLIGESDDYLNDIQEKIYINKNESLLIFTKLEYADNLINYLLESNQSFIYIGNRKYDNGFECLSYENKEDIEFIMDNIAKNRSEKYLVIEDVNCLISFDEEYLSKIYKILQGEEVSKTHLWVISKSSLLPYKLVTLLKNKYILDSKNGDDQINIFGNKSNYKGDCFYGGDVVLPFVRVKVLNIKDIKYKKDLLLKRIPAVIQKESEKGFIGYDTKTKEKIYIKEKLCILVSDEELLKRYKELFKDMLNANVCLYDNSLIRKEEKNILYIGEGLYTQRMFMPLFEIEEGEGYLKKGNKNIRVKLVNE